MMNENNDLLTLSQNDIHACHQHVAFLHCLQTSILERVTAFKQDQCGGRNTFFTLLYKNIKSQTTSTTSHTICFLYLLPSKVIRNDNTKPELDSGRYWKHGRKFSHGNNTATIIR